MSRSFEGMFWTSLLGAFTVGMIHLILFLDRLEHPRHSIPPVDLQTPSLVLAAVFGLLAVLLALQGFFSTLGARYELGASELTIRSGNFWRQTTTVPLVGITRIESVRGPLMRLLGLWDLRIYSTSILSTQNGLREHAAAVLLGVREGEDLRRYLLERRDTLHESVLRGDLSVARTGQELQMERLSIALERLEQRLPRT